MGALAQLLIRLEAEPQLRTELGLAAAQRSRDFSPDAIAEQVMHTYELAGRKK